MPRSSTVSTAPSHRPPWRCCAALAARPGAVVSRALLAGALPRGAEGHAIDMAVARLRSSLGAADLVETVIKRGYRLRMSA